MAMRWQDGAPISTEQWLANDPTLVQNSTGTAFSEWAIAAVEIARVAADRDGDAALLAKCIELQRRQRSDRKAPPDGGIDRLAEWDAIAWPKH